MSAMLEMYVAGRPISLDRAVKRELERTSPGHDALDTILRACDVVRGLVDAVRERTARISPSLFLYDPRHDRAWVSWPHYCEDSAIAACSPCGRLLCITCNRDRNVLDSDAVEVKTIGGKVCSACRAAGRSGLGRWR